MAEFVQRRLEESLPILQELQKAGVFNANEIRVIIKKRKAFEYRLQRHVKTKEDYLVYIQYEIHLLRLLHLRQKRLMIKVDYSKVDYQIVIRINAIFRRAVFRFPSDVKLWLSFIKFVNQVKWKDTVSRLYAGMLRVHADKPEIWIAAARYELEIIDAPGIARSLLLRGLRFHPKSKFLYLEYFKMELLQAKKKWDELGIEFHRDVSKKYADDPVVTGKIVIAVYKNATDVIPDVSFAISFLKVCQAFHFTFAIQKIIYDDLKNKYPMSEEAVAIIAREPFQELTCSEKFDGNITKHVELQCLHRMEEAVEKLPTEKMFSFFVDFCHDLVNSKSSGYAQARRINHLMHVMFTAATKKLLQLKYYDMWASYANEEEYGHVMELATSQFPKNVTFWMRRILHHLQQVMNADSTLLLIEEALKSVPSEESLNLWNVLLSLHMANWPKNITDVFERGLAAHESVASWIKTRYLEWVLLKDGIKAGRKLFQRLWSMPPITLDFFDKACEMELSQPKPSMKHLCKVMDASCSKFGTSNVDLWIGYLELVKRFSSDVGQAGTIHWRAIKALDQNLVDKFITHHTLLGFTEN